MIAFVRGIRGDLGISARPACLLVLVGVAVIAGLSSAVMQDAAYAQLVNARFQIEQRPWDQTACARSAAVCRQLRTRLHRESVDFLTEQDHVAAHVAELQTPMGVAQYSTRFMALGGGAIVIALLATLTIAAEWKRRTIGSALVGISPSQLARRRLITLFILACVAVTSAAFGTSIAAVWGRSARPLGSASNDGAWESLLGAAAVIAMYCAIASAVAWTVRDAMRTLLFSIALAAAVAFTTTLGSYTPGAAVASALGIHRLLEIEVGYFWIWPALTFYPGTASAARLLPALPWFLGIIALAGGAAIALAALARTTVRADPLA